MPMFPKAGKRMQTRRQVQAAIDRAESAAVRKSSDGICEIEWAGDRMDFRCNRRAVHVHHELSGRGVRGIGPSALAANKVHVCAEHHDAIHAHRLVREGRYWKKVA